MAQLRLISVKCFSQQEKQGDEIYFVFHDPDIWRTGKPNTIKDMDAGEEFYPLTDRFDFDGYVSVTLLEEDLFTPPNKIATHRIFDDPGTGSAVFSYGDATYRLHYEVIA